MAQLSTGGGAKVTLALPPGRLMARASTRTGSLTRQAGSLLLGSGLAGRTRLPGMEPSDARHDACPDGASALVALEGAGAAVGASVGAGAFGMDGRSSGGRDGGRC